MIKKGRVGIYISSKTQNFEINNNMFSDVNKKIYIEKEIVTEEISSVFIISILLLLLIADIIIIYFLLKKKKTNKKF